MKDIQKFQSNINFGPRLFGGMKYKTFFGIDGALPINFTDRFVLRNNCPEIARFLDEAFASEITKKEKFYYSLAHQIYSIFLPPIKKHEEKKLLVTSFKNKYNILGLSKLSRFIIGSSILYYKINTKKINSFSLPLLLN